MPGPPLTIIDLIENNTIPAGGAALLWWALERGASLFVAAAPRQAGKSTLATALLDFLPEDARCYVTAGPRDPLLLPGGPGPVYLLVNELSNHTPYYLSGRAAAQAFTLLGDGVRMIGALHADSAAEAVAVMREETAAPAMDIACISLIVVLRAGITASGVLRRVVEISLLSSGAGGGLPPAPDRRHSASGAAPTVTDDDQPVTITSLGRWDDAARNLVISPSATGTLAAWAAGAPAATRDAIARREDALARLVTAGGRAPESVQLMVGAVRAGEGGEYAPA